MTASDDLWDSEPQPTPDAVLDWIADRINARPWPIEGGYPVRMQGIDDGTADLDLLPAGFDPEEDWEDPPAPVVRYRITVSPWGPLPEPIPFEQLPATRQEQIRTRIGEIGAEHQARGYLPPDDADRLRARVAELEAAIVDMQPADQAVQQHVEQAEARARTAEAAVKRVRAEAESLAGTREFESGPYWCGWDDALDALLRALDAAGTPATPERQP